MSITNLLYRFSAERVDSDNPHLSAFFPQQQKAYTFCKQYCRNKRVIEFGCGSGFGAYRITEVATSVTAIDNDCNTIQHCRAKYKKNNLRFQVNKAEQFISKRKFDVAISFQVIEHIESQFVENYLFSIKRALKPKGVCFISTPNAPLSSYNENPYHYKEYSGIELKTLLSRYFTQVTLFGVEGDSIVRLFEKRRKERVLSALQKDVFRMRNIVPRKMRQVIFDFASYFVRKKLNLFSVNVREKNYQIRTLRPRSAIDIIAVCR
ncbi:MAG: class I SAM-dependent methyltransferase [Candidatus Pacebacteria bacterium]|nr:class I SAM-dependent methyltransferase [Candidatus Paceibacterota bacterium]